MNTAIATLKRLPLLLLTALVLLSLQSCGEQKDRVFEIDELSAWCIIGFDSLDRTPEQRIELLKDLGLQKYGYNRGKGDYTQMKHEFDLAAENDINITSVFVWLNAKRDSIGKLSESNELLLSQLKEVSQKPDIWVSFSNNYFENIEDEQSLKVAADMITYLKSRADEVGCRLALYNHTGWFGKPQNQINILKAVDQEGISIVYNFHHAHDDVDDFAASAKLMKPYLSYVNLNGVKKGGPKIMDIGKGDHEYEMIRSLLAEGYQGPWGILGHIKTEDVKVVLERNLAGIHALNDKLAK